MGQQESKIRVTFASLGNSLTSILHYTAINTINIFHALIVSWITVTPFTNSNYNLFFHSSLIVPIIILHWITNDNKCCLTNMERNLLKKMYGDTEDNHDRSYIARLIEPVYDFNKNYRSLSKVTYTVTGILWLISTTKLYMRIRNGSVKSYNDLFIL